MALVENVKIAHLCKLMRQGMGDTEIATSLKQAGNIDSINNARKSIGFLRTITDGGNSPEAMAVMNIPSNGEVSLGTGEKIEQNLSKGTAEETVTVDCYPQGIDEFISKFKTDLTVWKPVRWKANQWANKYQIKVDFELRKGEDKAEEIREIVKELKSGFKKAKTLKVKGSGVGVIAMGDFHYGANYKGDLKNLPFSVESLTQSVREAADGINALGLKEVHLALLGDFIESFTGLNHMDAWKSLESYGRDAVVGVAEMLRDELILRVKNIKAVYMVAGNHDRISNKSDIDSRGEAARLVADFLELMVDVPIVFDYTILNPEIDGIKYLLTHGHLGLSKMDASTMILEYGNQNLYNVIINAHGHTVLAKTGTKVRRNVNTNIVSLEGSNFIKIQTPPMVTGGAYSHSIGGYSSSGYLEVKNSGKGKPSYSFKMS